MFVLIWTITLQSQRSYLEPIYKITNRGLVGITYECLSMANNNLSIDYQCTIRFSKIFINDDWYKFIKKNTLFYIGKILAKHWQ